MRAVLLSPVVVLVVWSVATVMFVGNNHHVIGQSNKTRWGNNRNQRNKNKRHTNLDYSGNLQNVMLQYPQNNGMYSNGNTMNGMMMVPQQQLSQGMINRNSMINNPMANGYGQQQQVQAMPLQPQGNPAVFVAPLGNGMNSNVIPPSSLQQGQQNVVTQPQVALTSTNNAEGTVGTPAMAQPQQMHEFGLNAPSQDAIKQASMTTGSGASDPNQPLEKVPNLSESTPDQLQNPTPKQAVYYYDPKGIVMSTSGDILEMPTVVFDGQGKAVSLAELRRMAPVSISAPTKGGASPITGTLNDNAVKGNDLVSPSSRGSSLSAATPREAVSIPKMPMVTSISQDQTIIVATVAVMALLVGALSARRMRSKSVLSACIENENLEDDVAYDDAYTTMGAGDSSYNTFGGGWKGDLEKFDV